MCGNLILAFFGFEIEEHKEKGERTRKRKQISISLFFFSSSFSSSTFLSVLKYIEWMVYAPSRHQRRTTINTHHNFHYYRWSLVSAFSSSMFFILTSLSVYLYRERNKNIYSYRHVRIRNCKIKEEFLRSIHTEILFGAAFFLLLQIR